MGRKIIKSEAAALLSCSESTYSHTQNGMNSDEFEAQGIELIKAEASLDYHCNLSPHRHDLLL